MSFRNWGLNSNGTCMWTNTCEQECPGRCVFLRGRNLLLKDYLSCDLVTLLLPKTSAHSFWSVHLVCHALSSYFELLHAMCCHHKETQVKPAVTWGQTMDGWSGFRSVVFEYPYNALFFSGIEARLDKYISCSICTNDENYLVLLSLAWASIVCQSVPSIKSAGTPFWTSTITSVA